MAISTSGSVSTNAQASVVAGMYWNPFLAHVQRNGAEADHDAAIIEVVVLYRRAST